MKHKKLVIIALIIIFITVVYNVFARQEDEPPLEVKIKMYQDILAKAKELNVDTSEAENLMDQAKIMISAGFITSGEVLIEQALLKMADGIRAAGGDTKTLLTPSEGSSNETPVTKSTPEIITVPTSTPVSIKPAPTIASTNLDVHTYNLPYENTFFGGTSLLMAEQIPLYWFKPEEFARLQWDMVEADAGVYKWDNLDKFYARAFNSKLNLFVTISGIPLWDYEISHRKKIPSNQKVPNMLPTSKDSYISFIKMAVERYDRDENADSPMPVQIKYFQLCEEMDSNRNTYGQINWSDTVENYAILLRWTKKAMKESNIKAQLILGGSSDLSAWGKAGELNPITRQPFEKDGWFVELFESLRTLEEQETLNDGISIYFDGVDFHHYGGTTNPLININLTYKPLDVGIDLMKTRLYEYGYKDASIWVTGNSIYTGTPAGPSSGEEEINYVTVSEKEQAIYLVKSLVVPISKGSQAVFWSKFIDDPPETLHFGKGNTFYCTSGLVNRDQTKKLSFYTFKLLNEYLTGAKFNQIFKGLETNVYGYAFVKNNRPCYIFWNDASEEKTVRISAEQGKTYSITSLITGQDGQVKVEERRADQGLLIFKLASEPVFIAQK